MSLNNKLNPCEWCGSVNDECPCGSDEDPHEISELHVIGPGPNGYAVTDDRGTVVADGLTLAVAQGYTS